jgi:hypothetical protein
MSSDNATRIGKFALSTPQNWQIASIILVGPPDAAADAAAGQAFQQNVVVVSEPVAAEETAETYVQKQTGKLKEQKALYAAPGQLEKVALGGGRSAALFEHVVLGPNGERVRQMQVVSLHAGRMHALIASHLDGPRFAAHRSAFRQMLTSAAIGDTGFALPAADDWQIASVIMVGPPDEAAGTPPGTQNFQQNIVVVSEQVPAEETAEAYVQKQTAKLKEQKALFASPGQLEKINLADARPAVIFEHVVLGPNGERVRQMQVVSLHAGRMHALIASHLDGPRFAAHRASLRSILTAAKLP